MIAKKKRLSKNDGCLKYKRILKNDRKKGEVKTAASKHYYSLKVDCKKDVCLKKTQNSKNNYLKKGEERKNTA